MRKDFSGELGGRRHKPHSGGPWRGALCECEWAECVGLYAWHQSATRLTTRAFLCSPCPPLPFITWAFSGIFFQARSLHHSVFSRSHNLPQFLPWFEIQGPAPRSQQGVACLPRGVLLQGTVTLATPLGDILPDALGPSPTSPWGLPSYLRGVCACMCGMAWSCSGRIVDGCMHAHVCTVGTGA